MKYLCNYTENAQTELFNKVGAFFAFSNKQFDEGKKEGVKYSHLGAGLICPVGTGKEIMTTLDRIHKDGIQQDLAENSKEGVIKRELANHECYYTGDISACVDALADYGITKEEILAVYRIEQPKQEC